MPRHKFRLRFALLVGLQMLLLLGLIGYKQITLATGERILLKTVPVDPRDMFRGDYVTLRYELSRLENSLWHDGSYQKGDSVFVTLERRGRFWNAASVSKSLPAEGTLFLRGRVTQAGKDAIEVE